MGKIIAVGGFWDGKLKFISKDTDSIIETYNNHTDTITVVITD